MLQTHLNQRYCFAAEVLQDINAALDSRHQNWFSPKKSIAPTLINTDNSANLSALQTPDSLISPTKCAACFAKTFSLSVRSNFEPTVI
ncbi:hypothetical protein QUA56_09560 [Microcoleus sp. N3A4]|uniref:hypothetical protein n=1 Tax=Microcoleus sp. N3A4 TaxID=3055379 RepID=UPI002FD6359E